MGESPHPSSNRNQIILLCIGLLAIVVATMSIIDMFSQKPNDGCVWLLGYNEVKIIDVVPGGPAARAGLMKGDIILGIDNRIVTTPVDAAKVLIQQEVGSTVPYLIQRGKDVFTHNLVLGTYRTADFKYVYYCFLGIVFFIIGVYVFKQKREDRVTQLFYLMCLSFMLFFVCSLRRSSYYWIDVFVQNAGALSLFLLPAFFLHFFLIFPKRKSILSRHKYILYAIYAIPPILHARFTLHQIFGLGRPFEALGINFINWSLLGVYLIFGIASLVHSYTHAHSPIDKRQIKMLLWGTTTGLIPFLIFGVFFVSIFHNTNYLFLGVFPMLLIPLSFGYSIIRYHLMNIDVIIKRSLVYTILTGFLLGLYLLLVNVIGRFVQSVTGIDNSIVVFLSVVIIAILFAPARERIQRFIDRTFYKGEYSLHRIMNTLTEKMNAIIDLNQLLEFLLVETCNIWQVHHASLLMLQTDSHQFRSIHCKGKRINTPHNITFESGEIISLWEQLKDRPLTTDEIRGKKAFQKLSVEVREQLLQLKMFLWVPLVSNGEFVGIMALGEKNTGDIYAAMDREWLHTLARRAAFAIQNARLVENIAKAKEKLFHAEKLASLGQLASGVAHEIRNPLSAIQMNLQSLSKQVGRTPLTKRRFEIALSEVDRLEKLVQGILTFARSSPLNLKRVDIHTVLDNTLTILEEEILTKHIVVKKRYNPSLPLIHADRDKLIQVFLNVFLNAVQVLDDGGTIEVNTNIVSSNGTTDIQVSIADNGPGMTQDIAKNAFHPFFTTRAEGTGLGLTNALKFVEQHGGTIEAQSERNQGTVFNLFFPLHDVKEITG